MSVSPTTSVAATEFRDRGREKLLPFHRAPGIRWLGAKHRSGASKQTLIPGRLARDHALHDQLRTVVEQTLMIWLDMALIVA